VSAVLWLIVDPSRAAIPSTAGARLAAASG